MSKQQNKKPQDQKDQDEYLGPKVMASGIVGFMAGIPVLLGTRNWAAALAAGGTTSAATLALLQSKKKKKDDPKAPKL